MQARFLSSEQAGAMLPADALVVRPSTWVASFIGLPVMIVAITALVAWPWIYRSYKAELAFEIPANVLVMTAVLLGLIMISHLRYMQQLRRPDSWLFALSTSQLMVRLQPAFGASHQDPRFAVLAIDSTQIASAQYRTGPLVHRQGSGRSNGRRYNILTFTFRQALPEEVRVALQLQSKEILLAFLRRWLPIAALLQFLRERSFAFNIFGFEVSPDGQQLELRLVPTSPSWSRLLELLAARMPLQPATRRH